jgi:hypothetical protein
MANANGETNHRIPSERRAAASITKEKWSACQSRDDPDWKYEDEASHDVNYFHQQAPNEAKAESRNV